MTKTLLFVAGLAFGINAQAQITFTEITGTPFEAVNWGAVGFADLDGDGDSDLLLTGINGSINGVAKRYSNDGMGTFSEVTGTPFEGVGLSSMAITDVDGDGDSDVLITGNGPIEPVAKLYSNDGTGSFTEVTGTPFEGVRRSSIAVGDVDGDGDPDVLISGDAPNDPVTKLYINDGSGFFTEATGTPFEGLSTGAVAIADMDGDGDSDVLISGEGPVEPVAKLYANDGTGAFTEVSGTPFAGVRQGSIAVADVDGDGDSDVLLTGLINSLDAVFNLYTNDGTGAFTEVTNTPFEAVFNSSMAVEDVDGDGDSDVLITGVSPFGELLSNLYLNDGTGTFSESTGAPFEGVTEGATAIADVDGDGDFDVLITGDGPNGRVAKLYRNERSGDRCATADDINSLFSGTFNTPSVSGLFDNTGYSSTNDPSTGFDCFGGAGTGSLENTRWYTFTGDGGNYRIRTVQCNATNYVADGNVQAAVYSGSCNNLTPVACNEDEDLANNQLNVQLELQTTAGTDYRMLIDGHDGLEGEFCLEVTRIFPTGVEEATGLDAQTFQVYPNPANDQLNWANINAQTAQVFDQTGRLVLLQPQPNGQLDITELPTGFYTVQLHTDTSVYTAKVVKQ